MSRPHSHYHKDVSKLQSVDVYRVLQLFEVTDQALGHAVKKLMCAGKRGGKSFEQDVREAVDTLNRRLQMLAEDETQPAKDTEDTFLTMDHPSAPMPPACIHQWTEDFGYTGDDIRLKCDKCGVNL